MLQWVSLGARCSGRCASITYSKGSSLNLSAKSSAASTDLFFRALRCSEGSARRQTTPLCRVLGHNRKKTFDAVSTDSSHSLVDCEFCVFLPKLPVQSERVAACQTPKQSELTSYKKYLQIPTLCSHFLCSDSSSRSRGTTARRTKHQVAPRSVLAARPG